MEKNQTKNGKDGVLSKDRDSNDRSLKMLGKRLKPRSSEIHHIAFGHSGPLVGPEALLTWSTSGE
jgi:hypothetical protein